MIMAAMFAVPPVGAGSPPGTAKGAQNTAHALAAGQVHARSLS